MRTAVFVQEFFQGIAPGGFVGEEPYEPKNLPLWAKQVAWFRHFPLGSIDVKLIVPKERLECDRLVSLYRVFVRMESEPALVCADDLPPKSRGTLVRMGVPHVVSNTAIFAPQLGLAYGKLRAVLTERTIQEKLSSVGLKLLAAFLLKRNFFDGNPPLSELQKRLQETLRNRAGYFVSLTTLSRVFQQLQELELVEVTGSGPHKRMHFVERQALWARLSRLEVETVLRRVETRSLPPRGRGYVLSGDSALAELSDLLPPQVMTIAMSTSDYRKWKEGNQKNEAVGDFSATRAIIELWREDTTFLDVNGCMNPIELALSLRRHTDPRVRIAVTQVLEGYGLDANLPEELPCGVAAGRRSNQMKFGRHY